MARLMTSSRALVECAIANRVDWIDYCTVPTNPVFTVPETV